MCFQIARTHDGYCSHVNKWVSVKKPSECDGLLRPNLDDIHDQDDPLFNSIYDYYSNRPDELEHLTLAKCARDYNILYRSKPEEQGKNLIESSYDGTSDDTTGATMWLKHNTVRICKRKQFADTI